MEILRESFFWWLCTLAFGLAVWPLVFLCLKKLPDRGLGLVRIFGLLLVGYFFWMGGMVHLWPNAPLAIWASAVLALGTGVALLRDRWQEPWRWVMRHWSEWLAYELVFLALFAVMVWIRANNPEAVGTEKPMELAFINATLRSPYFPPNDPWLSGYSISYYYLGYILTAMVAKVASVSGAVAFNLGVANSFSLAGLGAYCVLRNLLCIWDPANELPGKGEVDDGEKAPWRRTPKRASLPLPKYVFLALLAPFTLLWMGNLEGSLEVLYANHVGWENQSGFFWQSLDIQNINEPPAESVQADPSTWRWWWWWRASRVINDRDLAGNPVEVIDEFPAFSLTLGDLHPHVLTMPFLMAGIALALEILLRAGRLIGSRAEQWSFFLLSALGTGSLIFLNTWDFPALFGLMLGAAWIGWQISGTQYQFHRWRGGKAFLLQWGAFLLTAVVFVIPFLLTFASQAKGLLPNVLFPSHGSQYLVMFATLIVPIFFWLVWESFGGKIRPDWEAGWTTAGMGLLVLLMGSLLAGYTLTYAPEVVQELGNTLNGMNPMEAIGFVLIRRIIDPLPTLIPVAMAAMIVGLIVALWKRRNAPTILVGDAATGKTKANLFLWLLILMGAVLVLFPEYFYLRDQFGTRMNTVFKFYFQTWQYWSLAAAFAAVALGVALQKMVEDRGWLNYWVAGGFFFSILFFVLGAVYLPIALSANMHGNSMPDGPSLDASGDYQQAHPADALAIQWLAENAMGNGPVVEAVGGSYSEYARVATNTGIPTVLGWIPHEGQWRGGYREVGNRAQDIETLYKTTDWQTAEAILKEYQIRYVFYGELERRDFGEDGLAKLKMNLTTVYETPTTYIFEWGSK